MSKEHVYVVVESPVNSQALRRLLPAALVRICDFVVGRGRSAAVSDARTLLVLGKQRVALVLDAGTDDREKVKEQYDILSQLMRTAPGSFESGVFLAIPRVKEVLQDGTPVNQRPLVKDLVRFLKHSPVAANS